MLYAYWWKRQLLLRKHGVCILVEKTVEIKRANNAFISSALVPFFIPVSIPQLYIISSAVYIPQAALVHTQLSAECKLLLRSTT
jgi:hypothetical protein